jgi:hypothetical protein
LLKLGNNTLHQQKMLAQLYNNKKPLNSQKRKKVVLKTLFCELCYK